MTESMPLVPVHNVTCGNDRVRCMTNQPGVVDRSVPAWKRCQASPCSFIEESAVGICVRVTMPDMAQTATFFQDVLGCRLMTPQTELASGMPESLCVPATKVWSSN
ncbi:hypothetical protein PY254_11110 [Rhodanobacter sp. AS-Z3]|uniref:hypothetical protein n=1 Tax=Rhodanobacter sp. AS-Z3 TaxID=3031330 RepID=UPI00247AA0CB|nr:hypothetical protein [Rhodanobacter sp. AS-Z3]WEN13794.1 hypothetical protein PY254_11110 [Rhodanobacter sp. AS-Z3]